MFDFNVEINLDMTAILFGVYFIFIGVLYYIIFHKHHKRNNVEISELVSLVTKFYSLFILSNIAIMIGVYCIINANSYKDTRSDVVIAVLLGIIIISATIINFIFYVQKSLKDYNPVVREEIKKNTIKWGEIFELIFFMIFLFMPLWRIPKFIEIFADKKELIIEIVKSFALSIASLVLLFALNPTNIKEKLNKLFNKKYSDIVDNKKD